MHCGIAHDPWVLYSLCSPVFTKKIRWIKRHSPAGKATTASRTSGNTVAEALEAVEGNKKKRAPRGARLQIILF